MKSQQGSSPPLFLALYLHLSGQAGIAVPVLLTFRLLVWSQSSQPQLAGEGEGWRSSEGMNWCWHLAQWPLLVGNVLHSSVVSISTRYHLKKPEIQEKQKRGATAVLEGIFYFLLSTIVCLASEKGTNFLSSHGSLLEGSTTADCVSQGLACSVSVPAPDRTDALLGCLRAEARQN